MHQSITELMHEIAEKRILYWFKIHNFIQCNAVNPLKKVKDSCFISKEGINKYILVIFILKINYVSFDGNVLLGKLENKK